MKLVTAIKRFFSMAPWHRTLRNHYNFYFYFESEKYTGIQQHGTFYGGIKDFWHGPLAKKFW
jgi:hypothetical protein